MDSTGFKPAEPLQPLSAGFLLVLLASARGLMAGGDWERELRNKLRRLAGRDTGWLLLASTALEQQSEAYKKLFLEEEDDDHARKLVTEVMKREEPKVISLRTSAGRVVPKAFKSWQVFNDYLLLNGYAGLVPEGGIAEEAVIEWEELRTDVVYEPVDRASLDERFKSMGQELHHLNARRKEEFGDALRLTAAEEEGVPESADTLLPDARVHYGQDAVVRVQVPSGPVLYVGSHNEYSNDARDVDDVKNNVATTLKWTKSQQAPASVQGIKAVKSAFMAESLGFKGKQDVPSRCKSLGVLQLRRSHGAIVKARAVQCQPAFRL